MSKHFYVHRDAVSGERKVHDYEFKRLDNGLTYFTAGPHAFGFVSPGRAGGWSAASIVVGTPVPHIEGFSSRLCACQYLVACYRAQDPDADKDRRESWIRVGKALRDEELKRCRPQVGGAPL